MIEESVETQDKRKLSKLAVLALIFSIVGPIVIAIDHCFVSYDPNPYWNALAKTLVPCFVAVPIIAIGAMLDIRKKKFLKGKGIAKGSIVLMVMGVVLLLPLNGAVKPYARNFSYCQDNLRWLGEAFVEYAEDHDGRWPAKENWCDQLAETRELREGIFQCPSDRKDKYSYAMNINLPDLMEDTPVDMVLLFESIPGKNMVGGPELAVTDRHQELRKKTKMSEPGCNVFLSHWFAEFVKPEEIENLKWKIERE